MRVKKLLIYREKIDAFDTFEYKVIDKHGREVGEWKEVKKRPIKDPKSVLNSAEKWTIENGKSLEWIVNTANHNTSGFLFDLFGAVAGPMRLIGKKTKEDLGSFNKISWYHDSKFRLIQLCRDELTKKQGFPVESIEENIAVSIEDEVQELEECIIISDEESPEAQSNANSLNHMSNTSTSHDAECLMQVEALDEDEPTAGTSDSRYAPPNKKPKFDAKTDASQSLQQWAMTRREQPYPYSSTTLF